MSKKTAEKTKIKQPTLPSCKNCQTEMQPLCTGYECTQCGLIQHQDGGVIYDPKDPRWLAGPAV